MTQENKMNQTEKIALIRNHANNSIKHCERSIREYMKDIDSISEKIQLGAFDFIETLESKTSKIVELKQEIKEHKVILHTLHLIN